MMLAVRILSGAFVSLPAVLVGACAHSLVGDEYYRPTYLVVCAVFLVASFGLGFLLSPHPHETRFLRGWTRLFVAGTLAWILALTALGTLNLTPLCVGQDNGDGFNSLGMCMGYTVLVAVVYSPLVLTLLGMNAALGGALVRVRKGQSSRATR
jgi:hypothetical protein